MRLLSLALLCVASVTLAQEKPHVRWSLSTGPSIAIPGNGVWFPYDQAEDAIAFGQHGRYHAALGVSRALGGTALVFRGEALYNLSGGSHRNRRAMFPYPGFSIFQRYALRDESYALSAGLEWDALPSKAWSPYLLTAAGWEMNRLRWSRDTTSERLEGQHDSFGILLALGGGVRVRVGKRELFSEFRRYWKAGSYGSSFAPLSLGVRF